MSVISSLKTYLLTYPNLASGAGVGVDFLGPDKVSYSIVPTAGDLVLEEYIDGGSMRAFPFSIQSLESTADELARIDALGFYETLVAWLESQSRAGVLPTLDAGKTAWSIEASGWGYLYSQGDSATGIYQVQCRLIYEQAKP
jgi:hypothetical protein